MLTNLNAPTYFARVAATMFWRTHHLEWRATCSAGTVCRVPHFSNVVRLSCQVSGRLYIGILTALPHRASAFHLQPASAHGHGDSWRAMTEDTRKTLRWFRGRPVEGEVFCVLSHSLIYPICYNVPSCSIAAFLTMGSQTVSVQTFPRQFLQQCLKSPWP